LGDAGWHFSYQGGVESIATKIGAYSHVEYNSERFTTREAIVSAIEEKKDLFGRPGRYEVVPIDRRFPSYLQEHAVSRYGHLLAPTG
jgi:beta-1,4-mannosyl-glycoprotein beta-1,4-N-acetylglucosaminyltransferase